MSEVINTTQIIAGIDINNLWNLTMCFAALLIVLLTAGLILRSLILNVERLGEESKDERRSVGYI